MEDISFTLRPVLTAETVQYLNLIGDFPLDSNVEINDILKETFIDRMVETNSQFINNYSGFIKKINDSFEVITQITRNCANMHEHVQMCKANTREMINKAKILENKKLNLTNDLNAVNFVINEFMVSSKEEEAILAGKLGNDLLDAIKRIESVISRATGMADTTLKNEIRENNREKLKNACFILQESIEEKVKDDDFCLNFGSIHQNLESNLKEGLSILRNNNLDLSDMWVRIVNIRRERTLMDFIAESSLVSKIGGDPYTIVGDIMNWLEKRIGVEMRLVRLAEGGSLTDRLNRITADIVQPLKDKIEQYIFSLSDYTQLQKIYSNLANILPCLAVGGEEDRPVKIVRAVEELTELSKNIFFNSLIHHCNMLISFENPKQLVPPSTMEDIVYTLTNVLSRGLNSRDIAFVGKMVDSALKVCSVTSCRLDPISSAVYNINFHRILLPMSHYNAEKGEMLSQSINTEIENLASMQARLVLESSKLILFYQEEISQWPVDSLCDSANGVETILKNYRNFTHPQFGRISDEDIWLRVMRLGLQTVLRIYEEIYTAAQRLGVDVDTLPPVRRLREMGELESFI